MSWYVIDTDGYKREFVTKTRAEAYVDEHDDVITKEPLFADGKSAAEVKQQLRQQLTEKDPNWKHRNFRGGTK